MSLFSTLKHWDTYSLLDTRAPYTGNHYAIINTRPIIFSFKEIVAVPDNFKPWHVYENRIEKVPQLPALPQYPSGVLIW